MQGGWKETRGVQRPISGRMPVSESRVAPLNPYETKRRKAPSGTSHQVREWFVAEGTGQGSYVLCLGAKLELSFRTPDVHSNLR